MRETPDVRPVRIHWDKDRCTNCLSCAVVCSERHVGMSAPSRSNIRISVHILTGDYDATYCRQCRNAPCAEACPVEAIRFDDRIHAWLVDDDLCTGCGECLDACPFDAIRLDVVTGLAAKCDLCLGKTRCVEICPPGALSVRGREEAGDGR